MRISDWSSDVCSSDLSWPVAPEPIGRPILHKSLIHNYPMKFHNLAMRRANSWMEAINRHAVADAMVCSKSLARRRSRFSQASDRSTTPRRGRTTKPFQKSDRMANRPEIGRAEGREGASED